MNLAEMTERLIEQRYKSDGLIPGLLYFAELDAAVWNVVYGKSTRFTYKHPLLQAISHIQPTLYSSMLLTPQHLFTLIALHTII